MGANQCRHFLRNKTRVSSHQDSNLHIAWKFNKPGVWKYISLVFGHGLLNELLSSQGFYSLQANSKQTSVQKKVFNIRHPNCVAGLRGQYSKRWLHRRASFVQCYLQAGGFERCSRSLKFSTAIVEQLSKNCNERVNVSSQSSSRNPNIFTGHAHVCSNLRKNVRRFLKHF